MRKIAWRTSLAVNSPQFSWNLTPVRNVMVQVLPSGAISHFSASSGIYAPVLRSMPTRYSSAGRLSSMPLMVCNQEKLVSYPRGATAILSRSSFAFAGGAAVCAQAPVTTNPIAPTTPTRVRQRPYLCIVISLWRQLDVLQVGEVAGDHPRKDILRDIFGVHSRLSEQPEHGYLSEFGELMVPDLAQQSRPFSRVHRLAQGFQSLLNKRMLIGIDRRILGLIEQADSIQGAQSVAQGPDGPVDGLGPILLAHSGKVDFHQLGLESYGLPVERYGLPNIHHLWKSRQGGEVH